MDRSGLVLFQLNVIGWDFYNFTNTLHHQLRLKKKKAHRCMHTLAVIYHNPTFFYMFKLNVKDINTHQILNMNILA